MAFGYRNLGTGALNSAVIGTIYTCAVASGAKLAELILANQTGADVDCVVTISGQYFGTFIVPGADKVRGNQVQITMNTAVANGELVRLTWGSASASLTHHLSGTELS